MAGDINEKYALLQVARAASSLSRLAAMAACFFPNQILHPGKIFQSAGRANVVAD